MKSVQFESVLIELASSTFCIFLSCALADVRLHQIVSTASALNGSSPSRQQQYAFASEQTHTHLSGVQRHTDSRLPPDLLPYGQHQSLVLQSSSLKNSSSSSTGSSTSTAILDHRNPAYHCSTNNGSSSGSGSGGSMSTGSGSRFAAAFTYTDDRLSENLDDDDDEHDTQQLFVRRTPIEEPDLRIYSDNIIKTTKSYAKLNSPSPTTTTTATSKAATNTVISTTKQMSLSTHRPTTNIYELTPASAILNTNYSVKHFNKSNASKMSTLQMNPVSNAIDNDSTVNCKPRQSVVRTSPSFSFLSTGYNQQQDNFL